MLAKIEVANKKEAALIRRGLQDPQVRALVKITGALKPLDERAKIRVLNYVSDKLDLGIIVA